MSRSGFGGLLCAVLVTLALAPGSASAADPRALAVAPPEFDRAFQAQQERLEPALLRAATSHGFASAYFDNGSLVILTTDAAAAGSSVSGLAAADRALIKVAPAAYSRVELDKTQAALEDALPDLLARGIVLNSIGVNGWDARVDVGVSTPSAELSALLAKEFGPAVRVVAASPGALFACNNRDDCGTMGSLTAQGKFTYICTTGFLAKVNSSGAIRMFTAGHCIKDTGGVGNNFPWHNLAPVPLQWGQNRCMIFGNNAAMDSGCFELPTLPADRNQYFASGPGDTRDIVGTVHEAGQWLTRQICRGGYKSGWDCGSVNAQSVTKNVGTTSAPIYIRNLFVINIRSQKGDSGAGMVAFDSDFNTYAAGTLVGGTTGLFDPDETWYSTTDDFEAYFGVTVCHNNGCT